MKILFLCKKFPYPLKDGESIAVSNLCRDLKALGCDLSLLCMNTSKHYSDPGALPSWYNYFTKIHTIDLDNSIRPFKALASMMNGESYHVSRFNSKLFRAKLEDVLKEDHFDIIQLETLYVAPYIDTIRQYSEARIVMRAHNVEHEIWERITRNTSSHVRRLYLAYLTRKLKEYEIGQFPAYDYLVTLTDRDLQLFRDKGYTNGASSAPIGFDTESYTFARPEFGPNMSICFIGSLDWLPNLNGLEWFLSQCWPEINRRWPGITFHIAGRNTPVSLLERKLPNVIVHGEVADAAEFINKHAVMVVPLFSGSGMRVKIVEGMMMGKVIITTSVGKEGIDGKDHQHFLVADDAQAFIDAIGYCVDHPEAAVRLCEQARDNAGHQFDSSLAARKILDIYYRLLGHDLPLPMHTTESTLTS